MESKQEIELVIRTSMLIKTLSQLIGRWDALTCRLVMQESAEKFDELVKFVQGLK